MEISKRIFIIPWIIMATNSVAMNQTPAPGTGVAIPFENNIRLVFMGPTGAGKSTLINAFYNYAQQVKWNEAHKHYPIPTEFQPCTVLEYQGRTTEVHKKGQLESVTQETSEYVSRGKSFVVNLVDCPGVADTRGLEQDISNTVNIAEFLKGKGDFNAICIVLPVTVTRDTAETVYFIEQMKTIIPKSMLNRVFTCVSYSTAQNSNIVDFVKSVGWPVENIFYFDNYATSKDGYKVDLTVDINGGDAQEDDPFSSSTNSSSYEDQKKISDARKVKGTWEDSQKEFYRMLRKAKDLGRHTSDHINRITEIKNSVFQEILKAYNKINLIEQTEAQVGLAEGQLQTALDNYNIALQSKNSADIALTKAQLEKSGADAKKLFGTRQVKGQKNTYPQHNTYCDNCQMACHPSCTLDFKGEYVNSHLSGCSCMSNSSCSICPGKCPYSMHYHKYLMETFETKEFEIPGIRDQQTGACSNHDAWQQTVNTRKSDLNSKQQDRDDKNSILTDLKNSLTCLKKDREALQHKIVELYVELGKVSMSSINFHIGEYFDVCIRKETATTNDTTKIAKLNRDRQFYVEQVDLYKKKIAQNVQ